MHKRANIWQIVQNNLGFEQLHRVVEKCIFLLSADGKHLRLDVEQTAQRDEVTSVKMAAETFFPDPLNFLMKLSKMP